MGYEKIKAYIHSVCHQIHWKKAHAMVAKELENHILDQRDAYMAKGMEETTALDKAIAQMGDPIIVGTQLDHTHRPQNQWGMMGLAVAILGLGFLLRMFFMAEGKTLDPIFNQVILLVIGIGVMFATYCIDFSLLGRHPYLVYCPLLAISGAAFLLYPFVQGRDIFLVSTPFISYLPLLFPLAFAVIVYDMKGKGYWGVCLCGFALVLFAGIALLIPTASGFLLFVLTAFWFLGIGILKNWFALPKRSSYGFLGVPVGIIALLPALSLFTNNYRWTRLQGILHWELDASGAGYVQMATRTALAHAKLFGKGSIPDDYAGFVLQMPKIDTDFFLTYLIYHVGWIAFALVMVVLAIFVVQGYKRCLQQKSQLGLFISTAIMLTFTWQIIGYVAYNLGFQLFAPISLPLISYGNAAMVLNLGLLGLMFSVFRNGDTVEDKNFWTYPKKKRVIWQDGKLIISMAKKNMDYHI